MLIEAANHAAKGASDITCSLLLTYQKRVMLHAAATHKNVEVVFVGVVVKQLRWPFVVLNAYPNVLNEPVQCFIANVFGNQICAAVKCVYLTDSDDAVLDEVLCVEEI